ncbi:MAG: chemotaxis protein CheW [Myxococcales bacterium]|nr:MAG: chemotaxis protein CheW [Myxococcales bacterium]
MAATPPLMLLFRVGNWNFALACREVEQVLARPRLLDLPGAAPAVIGSFVYRGALTPVVDLCRLLLGTPCPERISSRVLLARVPGDPESRTLGLLAESMLEARTLEGRTLTSVEGAAPLVKRLIHENGEVHQLLEIAAVARAAGIAGATASPGS